MTKRRNTQKVSLDADYDVAPAKQPRRGNKKYAPAAANSKVVNFKSYVQQRKEVHLTPKSLKQEEYIELLLDPTKYVVFATGPAGTGKTMLAVLAAIKAYKEGTCDKIIITRPAVTVDDEQHGFLPGDLNEKMAPWTRPIFDVMKEYYSPREITQMLEDEIIEVSPLAFLRGRTFKNSWIIFDEAQNSSLMSMKTALTRIGDNSKMIITGDLDQTDLRQSTNGLSDFLSKLKKGNSSIIALVEFNKKDIQRSQAVKEVLAIYER